MKQFVVIVEAYHKILSNTLRSRFISYAEEISVECQSGFRYNRSTIHIFGVCGYLRKNGNALKQCICYL
jgi:hypothetical protein